MEGKVFGVDTNKNTCYITADLSEDEAYDFCINSRKRLSKGLTLLESGLAPTIFNIGTTTIEKGCWFAKLGVEPNTLRQIGKGELSMVLKADNENEYGYKMPKEEYGYKVPQQYNKPNETFHKLIKYIPSGTQATLLDILDKAKQGTGETITMSAYDSLLKELDALSEAKFNFEEDRNGKKKTHTDNILNYGLENNKVIIKLSPYLSML